MSLVPLSDPVLTTPAEWDDQTQRERYVLADKLVKAMNEHGGYGLAAPQIGVGLRMFVLGNNLAGGGVFVNPELLTHTSDVDVKLEGCLSLPDYTFAIARWLTITVGYETLDGEYKTRKLWGMPARCFQHELDHLDGILINATPKLRQVEGDTDDTPVRLIK